MKFQEGKVKIKLSSDIQVLQSLLGIPPATACIWTGINTGKKILALLLWQESTNTVYYGDLLNLSVLRVPPHSYCNESD